MLLETALPMFPVQHEQQFTMFDFKRGPMGFICLTKEPKERIGRSLLFGNCSRRSILWKCRHFQFQNKISTRPNIKAAVDGNGVECPGKGQYVLCLVMDHREERTQQQPSLIPDAKVKPECECMRSFGGSPALFFKFGAGFARCGGVSKGRVILFAFNKFVFLGSIEVLNHTCTTASMS